MTPPLDETVPAIRYCPMCNRLTPIERTIYPPMIAITCRECGHVYRISRYA